MSDAAADSRLELADARHCVGARLAELKGTSVGRVEGVLVDSRDGTPEWLIVKLGRFGRRVAVPARFVAGVGARAWAAFPRGLIRGAVEIDPSRGLDAAQERKLFAHYGVPLDCGRAADLSGRTGEVQTSVPDAEGERSG